MSELQKELVVEAYHKRSEQYALSMVAAYCGSSNASELLAEVLKSYSGQCSW